MTLFWVVVIPIVVVIVALTLYDIFRHHLGGWAAWGLWLATAAGTGAWAFRKVMAGHAEMD